MQTLAQKINKVRQRIESACARVNRSPGEITLVAVTKTVSAEIIHTSIRLGLNTFGENRVQDARKKIREIGPREGVSWHMIGHLQTNKAKDALEAFNLIHSVDSLRLCEAINEKANKNGRMADVLLELNLSGEETKYGFSEGKICDVIKSMATYSNVRIKGLMTMAPFSDEPEDSRKYFRGLFNLQQQIKKMPLSPNVEMRYLSMGMTQDFEVAIEEGADIIRVGRAIFG